MSALNRLYETYGEQAAFFLVYIREAHPTDSTRPDRQIRIEDPETEAERQEVAQSCASDLGLKMPILIDNIDNATEQAYSAHPDRLFLINEEQHIAYRGGQGPRGFKPDELEKALQELLGAGD